MRHPHGETVSVKPFIAGSRDSHNNPVKTWGEPVEYAGCAVAPGNTTEDGASKATTSYFTVYGPYEMAVGPLDLIVYRGNEYAVQGDPQRWMSPFTGATPGCVVTIGRTHG